MDTPKTYRAADVTIRVDGQPIVGPDICEIGGDAAPTRQEALCRLRDTLGDAINPIIDAADPTLLPDRCLIVADVSRTHKTTFMQFYDAGPVDSGK